MTHMTSRHNYQTSDANILDGQSDSPDVSHSSFLTICAVGTGRCTYWHRLRFKETASFRFAGDEVHYMLSPLLVAIAGSLVWTAPSTSVTAPFPPRFRQNLVAVARPPGHSQLPTLSIGDAH